MGWLAIGAGVAFGTAMALLASFFVTKDERYDRAAEWSFVAFGLLGVPAAIAIADRLSGAGPASNVVAGLGIAGIAATALGELGTTLGLLDFRRVAAILSLAFVAILLWVGGASVLALSTGAFPAAAGWLGLATIVVVLALFVAIAIRTPGMFTGAADPPRGPMVAFFVPLVGIVAWLVWMGIGLG
ncbi:MAG TPA: hypothetical protein VFP19_05800 [Candidatus Limnocylindrales bacterium]|nr:hypothetical protein [Candidatus Limnocylindrales bacterium]